MPGIPCADYATAQLPMSGADSPIQKIVQVHKEYPLCMP